MSLHLHDVVGLLGIALIVSCYLLLQIGKLKSDDIRYPLMNALGALLIIYSITFEFNLSAFLVEVFWVVISLIGMVRCYNRRTIVKPSTDSDTESLD